MIVVGSIVTLDMPCMKRRVQRGIVVKIIPWFSGHKSRIEVHGIDKGHEFITICRPEQCKLST